MKSLTKRLNQRGQGAVEYVLLLGLTVAIVLGIILQFNNAFKVWANNYFGDYLTCLLETGELPTLGGAASNSECAALLKPLSLADGGAGGGKDGKGGSGDEGDDEDKSDDASGGNKTAAYSSSSDGNNSAGRSGRSAGGTRFAVRAKGSTNSDEEGDSKKGDQDGTGASFSSYDQNKNGARRILVIENEAGKKRRIEEAKKDKTRTKVKSDTPLADERQGAPLLQKVKKRTVASDGSGEGGLDFSFGNLLRWLLILAIIIAIVIFIGGQILQVSKSVD